MKIYVVCINYEGGQAAFSTLEKAIEAAKEYYDYVEEWELDNPDDRAWLNEPAWSRVRDGIP